MELSSPIQKKKKKKKQLKNILYFRKWNFLAPKISYISGRNLQILKNKNFLCFRKNIYEVWQ